jgi:hypothetical protein
MMREDDSGSGLNFPLSPFHWHHRKAGRLPLMTRLAIETTASLFADRLSERTCR